MAKVFSWKVAPEKYSYLVKDDSTNSYIRNKITDSNILHTMANIVNGWSEGEYSSNYNSMKAEVKSVYGEGVLPEDYREYWNISNITEGTVVLLSGKGGYGDTVPEGGDYFLDETDYKALIDKIEKEFEAQRNALEAKIEQLKTELARIASDSVGEAWNDTYNASKRLKEIEDRLREAAENAANALDFFRNLSSGGSITYQEIINTFSQITEFNNWYNDYGSGITRMYSGYTQFKAGLVGEFADGLEGAWGIIGTHLNSLSGTVGTVESRINAAEATISDVARWYNLSANTISEVKRTLDAKIGLIENAVNYINNELQNSIVSTINGMAGTITTDISTRYTGAINNIQQELNGLSASVSTKITHYDTLEGRLARVEDEMNASAHGDQANYTKAVTIAESAWTHADQMRETWSQASGMLRTVSELSIKEDQYGPIYWYIPNVEEPETKYRVKYLGKLNNELIFWQPSSWPTSDKPSLDGVISLTDGQEFNGGYIRKNDVYPDYVTNAFSFIQQAASHISMAVSRDDIKAAIELSVEDDESKIYLGANSILLDGKVIADSLTAKAANIGGVHIGYGMISAQTGDKKWALRSDGVLEAASANVRGVITADQLILGDGMTGGQGPQGIEDYVNSFVVQAGGMTETEVRNIVNNMAQDGHWGVVDPGGDYYIVGTTISGTTAESAFTVSKSGCLIAKNGIFSGTVFATNGVFNGKVYAKEGEFAGSISATNGYFSGDLVAADFNQGTIKGVGIYGSDIYGSSLHIGGKISDIATGNTTNTNKLNFTYNSSYARISLSNAIEDDIKVTIKLNEKTTNGANESQFLVCNINSGSNYGNICLQGIPSPIASNHFDASTEERTVIDIYVENVNNSFLGKTLVVGVNEIRGLEISDDLENKILWASPSDSKFTVDKNGNMSATSGYFTGKIEASEINGSEIYLTNDYPTRIDVSYVENPLDSDAWFCISQSISTQIVILSTCTSNRYIAAKIEPGQTMGKIYELDYNSFPDEPIDILDCQAGPSFGIEGVSIHQYIWDDHDEKYAVSNNSIKPEDVGNYDFYSVFNKSYSETVEKYIDEDPNLQPVIHPVMNFEDGLILRANRENGFFVDKSGDLIAGRGYFGGSLLTKFITIEDLTLTYSSDRYFLDSRPRIYIRPGTWVGSTNRFYLPTSFVDIHESVPIGFCYDLIVRPYTHAGGIYVEADQYIPSCVHQDALSGKYLYLPGGRYQFTLLPTKEWALIMATGGVWFYTGSTFSTKVLRYATEPAFAVKTSTAETLTPIITTLTGDTAPIYGHQEIDTSYALFIHPTGENGNKIYKL